MLLYYITDRKGFAGTEAEQRTAMLRRVAEAARAGVDYIQLREKDLDPAELELLAREALHVIRDESASAKLLINSRLDVALAVGADGVHLPADRPPVSNIRAEWLRQTDREPLLGVSAHIVADVQQAATEGASFAVLAPIFEKESITAKGIGLEVLREVCAKATIPVLALGGVNLSNARACLEVGVAGIAGIRLFQQGDVAETVAKLSLLSRSTG
jgi:thiamine-phosphate pyrophosphorylase